MIKIKIIKEREKLKGGQGDNRPDADFDPKQLAVGVKDETGEHTPSKQIGKEIAKDHLTKDPDYYRKLKAAGVDEYLQLREEEKKAAVMMSELLKQLEAHQNKIWVFFDTETSGMHPNDRQLTEIAGIAVKPDFISGNGKIINQYHTKIDLTPETQELIKQQGDMKSTPGKMSVKDILKMNQYFTSKGEKTQEETALKGFIDFVKSLESEGEVILLAHNAKFDRQFISVRSAKYGLEKLNNKTIDTLDLVYEFFYPLLVVVDKEKLLSTLKTPRGMPSFTLGTLSKALNIDNKEWHSALADVKTLIDITQQIVSRLQKEKDVDVRAGYEKSLKMQRTRKSWGKKKK